MNEIRIENLTQGQVEMLDVMWGLNSEEDYLNWYELLDQEDQAQADLLTRLIIIEELENMIGNQYAEANTVLQQFRL